MTSAPDCPLCWRPTELSSYIAAPKDLEDITCGRCGRFFVEPFFREHCSPDLLPKEELYRLSGATRRASDRGHPITITLDTAAQIAAEVIVPRGVLEKVDRLVVLMAERSPRFDFPTTFEPAVDFPLGPFLDEEEVHSLLAAASFRGWYDEDVHRLTVDGWARADTLRGTHRDSRRAFVAMAFKDEMRPAFFEGFKPGIEKSRYYVAGRVDEEPHNGKICDAIVAALRQASLVVVDVTHFRLSVFFEAGWAYGLGADVIWTCRKDQEAELLSVFDTRQYNHILWTTPADLAAQLDKRIRSTLLPPHWKAIP